MLEFGFVSAKTRARRCCLSCCSTFLRVNWRKQAALSVGLSFPLEPFASVRPSIIPQLGFATIVMLIISAATTQSQLFTGIAKRYML